MVKEEPMSAGERHSSKHEFESNQQKAVDSASE